MTFGTAALLLLLAVAGIIISCLCLRQKKALRAVCITVCALAALALTVYICLTVLFVDAVQSQPPTL